MLFVFRKKLEQDPGQARILNVLKSFIRIHSSVVDHCSGSVSFPRIRIFSLSFPDRTLMSTIKLTGTGNVPKYACCLAPSGPPNEKENQVKI
jgi:hypothetical protein